MDKKRSCENKCVFCFIDQLPSGMRETLYFKDDDSRLSFLHGNYVTLTNGLTQAGVPFVARLEPYSHCRILQRKAETRPWLYGNLRKYLKVNKAE